MMEPYAMTSTTMGSGPCRPMEFRTNESAVNTMATMSSAHQMRRRRLYSSVGGLK